MQYKNGKFMTEFTVYCNIQEVLCLYSIPNTAKIAAVWGTHKTCGPREKKTKKKHFGCARTPQAYLIGVHNPSVSPRPYNHAFSSAEL